MKISLRPKPSPRVADTELDNLSVLLTNTNLSTPESSPFFKQYYALQQHYEQKFGPKTVIVVLNGATYNIYEYSYEHDQNNLMVSDIEGDASIYLNIVDNTYHTLNRQQYQINYKKNIGKAIKLSLMFNLTLTSSNSKSKVHSTTNPFMIGFPRISYHKYREKLLMAQYTIIRVDETSTNSDGSKNRTISEIVNPQTDLESNNIADPQALSGIACLYIEYQNGTKNIDRTLLTVGLSYINVVSGENSIYEVYSKEDDELYALNEINRFLQCMRPADLNIYLKDFPSNRVNEYKIYFTDNLTLTNYQRYFFYDIIKSEYFTLNYQQELLNKIFPLKTNSNPGQSSQIQVEKYNPLSVFERLNVQNLTYGRLSYILLLNYCYDHKPELIEGLSIPQTGWLDQNTNLVLTNNVVQQLNLISHNKVGNWYDTDIKHDSLISVLDQCTTLMGSRLLKRRILNPITNIGQLNQYYDMTQYLIENNDLITTLHKHLRGMADIERLQRLAKLNMLKPSDLAQLISAYIKIDTIHTLMQNNAVFQPILIPSDKLGAFNSSVQLLQQIFHIDILRKAKYRNPTKHQAAKLNSEQCLIKPGNYQQVDEIVKYTSQYWQYLLQVCEHFSAIVGRNVEIKPSIERASKADTDDENTTGSLYKVLITTTKARGNTICDSAQLNTQLTGPLSTTNIKANVVAITSPIIEQCCTNFEHYNQMLENIMLSIYQSVVKQLGESTFGNAVNKFIANLDFIHNNARLAIENKYYRPNIVVKPAIDSEDKNIEDNKDSQTSWVKILDLRHALLEQIGNREYIPNDVELGTMLLYGVNSSGKTALARATGIAIIMAQCGMFVAGKMQYYPYNKIMARLSGNDDELKGQSSFMVEMYELAIILKNADQNSLILGDELSRGTESGSGTGLSVATFEELFKRKTSFIFATHMHHLVKMTSITKLMAAGLQIKHLTAVYDPDIDMLVYDRKLKEGSGSSLYGLEVCRSLRFDADFLSRAGQIRNEVVGKSKELMSSKKSRYDSKLYVDKCQICSNNIDLHTHHIAEQHTADEQGFIGYYHKDSKFNLLILCQDCHQKLHQGQYELIPKQINSGTALKIVKN